jgi:L-ascorbate metabolism protein UlaG (beta-lactamase superfamily)
MIKKMLFRSSVICITVILLTMNINVFSQGTPATDQITTSAGVVDISFIGHGTLMFKTGGFVIHIDPVTSSGGYDNLPKADLILVTHDHSDHLDVKLIEKLRKDGTVMFCNVSSAAKVPWATSMKAGDKKEIKNIEIEAVEAYNIVNVRAPGQPFHPKGVGIGFILTIGGKRFYIAGDTENTPEMKALRNIYVAFLPMNLPYTMTPEMVADAALAFKPAILYPYHYGETNTSQLVNLLKGSGIEVRIRDLK